MWAFPWEILFDAHSKKKPKKLFLAETLVWKLTRNNIPITIQSVTPDTKFSDCNNRRSNTLDTEHKLNIKTFRRRKDVQKTSRTSFEGLIMYAQFKSSVYGEEDHYWVFIVFPTSSYLTEAASWCFL